MGLFDRKYCDVCGSKIGLFGNRKLENGNLCKDCAKKLSYWFDDRRHSTVEEIKAQLAYREGNKKQLESFNITKSYGRDPVVAIDEDKRQFAIVRTGNIREENPDLISFSQVTGCDVDIEEDKQEEKRTLEDGREVSYNPPRYTWYYDFHMTIRVNHPYFDDMSFDLNDSQIRIDSEDLNRSAVGALRFNPRKHPDFLEYMQMANEIKAALTEMRDTERQRAEEAKLPVGPVICPFCGATTTPDSNGCCEYCMSPIK
ncbi:MAG: DUF4428 domain-containing protein [Clostridiales bacterium]|nr:DUF4428 domain-containing protein [Clostridiales bacterium]